MTSDDASRSDTSAIASQPTLPQPSFAPHPLPRIAKTPDPKSGSKTPRSPLYTCPLRHLSLRLASGRSTAFQSRAEPGTSFYLYLPSSHPVSRRWHPNDDDDERRVNWDGFGDFKVVVLIHGSVRDAERLRNSWAERAEQEGVVIVAPLWPARLDFPHGPNGYKYLKHPDDGSPAVGLRYDLILFDILEQVKADWGFIDTERFGLAGFSGGGQFVHRMLYLHPERISAVSIGAPGGVTPICPEPWPRGTLDTDKLFGISVNDVSRFASTRIQIIVGSEDHYRPVDDAGAEHEMSRYDIARTLHDNYAKLGIKHEWTVMEGGWHETDLFRPLVQDFMFSLMPLVDCERR